MTHEEKARINQKYWYYRRSVRLKGAEPLDKQTWYEQRVAAGRDPVLKRRDPRRRSPLWYAKLRYSRHRAQAKYRNIPWEFDFTSWYGWWLSHGEDRNIPSDERGSDRLCMARFGDEGAYNPDNVYLATHAQNTRDGLKNVPRDNWPRYKK